MMTISCMQDNPPPPVIVSPPCLLIKQSFMNPNAANSQTYNYTYDDYGFIKRIERIQVGGNYYINGEGPFMSTPDTSYYFYEYQNGLAVKTKITDPPGSNFWIMEHDYTGDLLTQTTVYFQDGSVQEYNLYKYDDQDRLIEVIDSSNQVNFRYTFEYDGENLASIENEILWTVPQQKKKYTYSNFDNQKNFASAIKGLPITFIWFNSFHSYSSFSPNNFQIQNYYSTVDINEDYGNYSTRDYSYEYNGKGFPTLMRYVGWEVVFEYDCN